MCQKWGAQKFSLPQTKWNEWNDMNYSTWNNTRKYHHRRFPMQKWIDWSRSILNCWSGTISGQSSHQRNCRWKRLARGERRAILQWLSRLFVAHNSSTTMQNSAKKLTFYDNKSLITIWTYHCGLGSNHHCKPDQGIDSSIRPNHGNRQPGCFTHQASEDTAV